MNGVDDKDYVVINEDDALPSNGKFMTRVSPSMQVKVRKVLMLMFWTCI